VMLGGILNIQQDDWAGGGGRRENQPVKRIQHATVVLPEGVVVFDAILLPVVTKWRN
jgi:hypothetical protein